MRYPLLYVGLACLVLLTVPARRTLERVSGPPAAPENPRRIVSLAPGITEILYALGLGSRVAGVTTFCLYPPEAASKPHVAGFGTIYAEAVVRARPDLAVLPADQTANQEQLERLGIPTLALDTRSLPGLMEAAATLGDATGRRAQADAVRCALRRALRAARERAAGKPRPRVLFSVMRSSRESGAVTEINVVGRDGFFNELIEAAGGENAYRGNLAFPRLSRESIMLLNPDVIVDAIPASEDPEAARRGWQSLASLRAVREGRLHLLTDSADTIPGPRAVRTLAKLSYAFHPDEGLP